MRPPRILQLEPYLERRPKDLSGGQRQRVAIGRAIVRQPKVFLFDEPLSNLDAALRGQMRIELSRLHEELNATMIYVTHDQVEAMTMADKIVVLQAGRVEQVGSPLELYHHPANLFVAGFIGSPRMNLMEAKVVEADARGASVVAAVRPRIAVPVEAGAARTGDAVTLGIRPEGLRIDPAGPIAATVALVERLGGLTLLHVTAAGNQPMTVQIEGSDATRAARPDPARGRSGGVPSVRQVRPGPAATGPASAGRLTGGCMFLGLDFGTSAVKALLVDGEQAVVASATVPLSVQRPAAGPQRAGSGGLVAGDAGRRRCARPRSCRRVVRRRGYRPVGSDAWRGAAGRAPAPCCVPPSCGTMSVRPPNAPSWRRLFPTFGR